VVRTQRWYLYSAFNYLNQSMITTTNNISETKYRSYKMTKSIYFQSMRNISINFVWINITTSLYHHHHHYCISLYLSSLWQLIRPDAFLFEIDSHALEHLLHRNMNLIDLQTFTGFHQLGVV